MVLVCFRSRCSFHIIKPPTPMAFLVPAQMSGAARSESLHLPTGSCLAPIPVVPERSNNPIWQMGREAKQCSTPTRQPAWEQGLDLLKLKSSLPFSYPFLVRYTCTGASVLSPEKNRAGPSCRAARHQEKNSCLLSNGVLLGGHLVLYSWITANIMNFKLKELPLFSLKNRFSKQCT